MNTRPDIATLLEPICAAAPCGEDLEYTADYAALQVAAAGRPEQQVGDMIVPACEPDWRDVVDQGSALLRRSHDLRIACRVAQGLLHVDGLPGLAAGLALVRSYLQAHWDDLYPRLDADDDHDPAIRVNALALLCNVAAIVHPLREQPLLRSNLAGAIRLRTIARAHGNEALPDDAAAMPSAAEIDGAFETMPLPELETLVHATQQARRDAAAIEAELARRVGAARALDFGALIKALAEIDAVAAPWLARRTPVTVTIEPALEPRDEAFSEPSTESHTNAAAACVATDPTPPVGGRESVGATVRHRADALRQLAAMCRWFEQHEPGHPVPILLERAQRWISMDYMDLLRDLAPEAAEQAEKLRGATA